MVLFGAAKRWEGPKGSPPSLTTLYISCNDETWHSYTLPKEDLKSYKSRETRLEICCIFCNIKKYRYRLRFNT